MAWAVPCGAWGAGQRGSLDAHRHSLLLGRWLMPLSWSVLTGGLLRLDCGAAVGGHVVVAVLIHP
jgi:hypothetical protein